MIAVSVVIITRNEEQNIVDCIRSAKALTDDIVVVDCGSEDATLQLAAQEGARTSLVEWQGFGYSRNFGASLARHNWILALDADERISPELVKSIHQLDLSKAGQVYRFRRNNHLAGKRIRFGTLGHEKVTRIYNRFNCQWDLSLVHERLVSDQHLHRSRIKGHIDHYGLKSFEDYRSKSVLYAQLSANKYYKEDRRVSVLKRFVSPLFNAVKSYVFQLGFLDGKHGIKMALMIAYYSWLKYAYLQQLQQQKIITKEFRTTLQPAKSA